MANATWTWRPLTTGDAPALARVNAAVEAVDRTGEHFSEQDIRDELEDEVIDLERDSLAALDADGDLVAYARVHARADVRDVDRVRADGAVVPAARGRGLGRRLLAWSEERAERMHRARHPGTSGAVIVVAHESNAGKEALVRAAGYEAIRWEHTMTHALDAALPDVPPTPRGLTLTPFSAERDEAVRRAHCEAFADHWASTPPDPARWARWYTGSRAFRPDVSRLAVDGDQVAGYALSYFWAADAAATGVREAFLGQIGVRPAWRRRGLGGLLLAESLRSYQAAGYQRAALAVDTANATGALGLYTRAGFAVNDTWAIWAKPLG